ncbi:MAG: head decoration protein, partial [Alphaproteobacteria bacterium]|nr:head decoration protein [Alphaproteobacteria bacterium]
GSGKYKEYNSSNTDGSQSALAVLLDAVDATTSDHEGLVIARQAEVNAAEIVWFTGATDAQKKTGIAQLKAQTIFARVAV